MNLKLLGLGLLLSLSAHAQIIKTPGVSFREQQLPQDGKEKEVILRYESISPTLITSTQKLEGKPDSISSSLAKFQFKQQLKVKAKFAAHKVADDAMTEACEKELNGRLKTDGRIYKSEKQEVSLNSEEICEESNINFLVKATLKASAVCVVNPRWLPARLRAPASN
jgi:hypothetical protein